MSRIKIFIVLFTIARCTFSQTTYTFDTIEKHHTLYDYSSGTYASNIGSGSIIAGVDTLNLHNHASAAAWNISELDDWGFITNSKFKCDPDDGPENTLSLQCNTMETRPSSHSDPETFMDDVSDGDEYYSGSVTSTVNEYRPFDSDFDDFWEGRLDKAWVAVGFEDGSPNQSVDTYTRFNEPKLRIDFEVRMSNSGELDEDERWGGSHEIRNNVTVPSGKTLTLWKDLDLDLVYNQNKYYIKSTGGTIKVQSGVDISPCEIIVKSGSSIKGYYPTLALALSNASSGQTVCLYSDYELKDDDIEVPSGVTLSLENGELDIIDGNYKYNVTTTNGTIAMNGGSVSPNIQRKNSSNVRKGLYPTISDAIDDAATNDKVYLGSATFTEDVDMPGNFELRGNTRYSTVINGDVTFDGVSSSKITNLTVNGEIVVDGGSSVYVHFLYAKDAVDIDLGSSHEIWEVTTQNSGYIDLYCSWSPP